MYEDDIFSPDQEEIFKGDGAALQAINLTAFTTHKTTKPAFELFS